MAVRIDPLCIISKYLDQGSLAYRILVEHGRAVADKSILIARCVADLYPDLAFIEEAAMLHDIGIFMTREPRLGCNGDKDYICHGYLGREMLDQEGLPAHGLVCERHIGVGLTVRDIQRQHLPIPQREMMPTTLEEKIICYADKFFSKRIEALREEKGLEEVRKNIAHYGQDHLDRFEALHALLGR